MQFQENFDLTPYNSFGIRTSARYYTNISSVTELSRLDLDKDLPQLILGGGSNLLFTKNFNGYVIRNEIKGIEKTGEDDDHVFLRVGAGENWHGLVEYCIDHNYAGIENLALIPGFTGASPMQNIGAYGVEIKDVFYDLEGLHIKDKRLHTFSLNDCEFGYRESVFKKKYKDQFVITSVTFRLHKQPAFNTSYGAINKELESMGVNQLSIQAISQAVINIRSSKLPDWKIIGNAGSFFKNPIIKDQQFQKLKKNFPGIIAFPSTKGFTKLAAGWLIEQCGWKGHRKGDAGCYPKQALVIVNYGNAKGEEIYNLSKKIIQSVKHKFGVQLEREVNLV